MSFIDIAIPTGFKCGFQNNLDFHNYKYCFKYEYGDEGKRCLIIGNDKNVFKEWFKSLPESQRKLYELIRENDIVAEFYDIDLKIEGENDVDELSIDIVKELLYTRNNICDKKLSNKDIIVLSAHTQKKLSLHIISLKTYFKNNKLQKFFAEDLFTSLNKNKSIFNIDTSVYSKNRCFRMYLNHKYGKNNKLVIFKPTIYNYASFESTWVVLTHADLSERDEIQSYTEEDITIMKYHDKDEELTDDLNKLLENFIENHPYFRVNNNRINRVEHITRKCLTDPSDLHSTENMYWYIKNNAIFIGCFCGKGQHICLGTREGIQKVLIKPEPFSFATHNNMDFENYSDFNAFKTLYDKRQTGSGKTTAAMKYAEKYDKVLLIHHRLSLDADYISKYPLFTSYQKDVNLNKQTVCFNSLCKIDINNYDLIIIDEIRSILKQTEMRDMIYSTHSLFNIFENLLTPLIMLDANLTDADVEFISKHRNDPNKIVIHEENVQTNKKIFIIEEKEEILDKIHKNISQKNKIVIIYNISIETMNALLAPYTDDYRILHINRLTRKNIDMNSELWYDNYDIIAYSPTISEGVSINDTRFQTVSAFGIFTSTSCPAESVSQMIARFRAIENLCIYINTKYTKTIPSFYSKKDVLKYINNNMLKLNNITKSQYNLKREGGKLVIIEDEFCELFCKNMYEQSKDYHNYRETLIQKLINNGYSVYENIKSELSNDEKFKIKDMVDTLKIAERKRINTGIFNSTLLNVEQYKQIKDIGVSSEDEEFKVQKYNILHTINISEDYLTENIIDLFRNSTLRYIVRNIKYCFGFIRNEFGIIERIPTQFIVEENASNQINHFDKQLTFLDQKSSIINYTTSKVNWLNNRIQELGFEYLFSPESISIDVYQNNMDKIISYYKVPKNFIKYANSELLFGKKFNKTKQKNITSKFLTAKFEGMFKLIFGKDKIQNKVYQQINFPIRLCDKNKMYPNILGNLIINKDIIKQYDVMFMKGLNQKYCEVCDVHFKKYINFTHLNSKIHQKNLNS